MIIGINSEDDSVDKMEKDVNDIVNTDKQQAIAQNRIEFQ